jgi:ABC-type transport system substrate-binding protein
MSRLACTAVLTLGLVAGALLVPARVERAISASDVRLEPTRLGGTLRVDLPSRQRYLDPTLSVSWQLMHATQLQLLGYPDQEAPAGARIVPEAAAYPRISRDGRTYTFRVTPGFRFSDGRPVTAANFALAINRALSPAMQADASRFVADIVGAADVQAGRARAAAGVRASGNTLTIVLTRPAPDFLARIALPHFAALPLDFPVDPEGVTQAPMHSAGPYYLKELVPGRSATVARNPYWRRALLPRRPANVDQIVFTYGNSLDAIRARLEGNETDLGPVAGSSADELYRTYGLNQSRFFVRKALNVWLLGFNHDSPLFAGNERLRRAINFAIDRPHLARQFGFLAGARTDQLLPPAVPGFADAKIYPLQGADVAKARALAAGSTRGGKAVLYTWGTPPGPALAEIVRFNLRQIGLDVEIKTFALSVLQERIQQPDEPLDLVILQWFVDYPDPASAVDDLLRQPAIHFRSASYDRRRRAAAGLTGPARLAAYGALDQTLMREEAPVAPFLVSNARVLVSESVGCFSFHPVTQAPNLVALCKR